MRRGVSPLSSCSPCSPSSNLPIDPRINPSLNSVLNVFDRSWAGGSPDVSGSGVGSGAVLPFCSGRVLTADFVS
jgi:hypothetical protein